MLGWICWGGLHSLLISPAWQALVIGRWPGLCRWYRLGYNLLAVATLVPLLVFKQSLAGPLVLGWPWWLEPVRWLLLLCALWLAWAGARAHDLGQVAGWSQLRSGCGRDGRSPAGELRTDGILGRVRHPWYSAALLLLWARTGGFDLADLATSLVLSGYVLLGARLEEAKLLRVFGPHYRAYQARVPMFLPRIFGRRRPL